MLLCLLFLLAVTYALGCDPGQVQNVTVTEVRSTDIRLSWSAPSPQQPVCDVRGYRVCSTPDANSCTDVNDTSITEHTLAGLQSCTQFPIRVMAIGDNNDTSTPVYSTVTTAAGPVNGLGVSRMDNNTITALWNYVLTTGRTCATQFQLSLCDARETNCTTTNVSVVSGAYYSQRLQRTRNCNAYVINLVALDSSQQRSDNFRFDGEPDSLAVPENLTVSNITSSSFIMEWGIPDSQVNCEYFVYVRIAYRVGITSYGDDTIYDGGRTTHSAKNITPCTACEVSVNFGNAKSDNNASGMVYTLPEVDKVIDNATVQDTTSTSVMVAWNTSLSYNQCIGAYTVCWAKQGETATDCRNATRDQNYLHLTGLAANTQYELSVASVLQTGVQYDTVTLQASTKSGAARLIHNSLVGISTIVVCVMTLSK